MLLNHYVTQIDEFSFRIKDRTSAQMYADAGIVDFQVTKATLVLKNEMTGFEYAVDILNDWAYIFDCNGLTINILDFVLGKMGDFDYFPDGIYHTTIYYDYNGVAYQSATSTGFKALIQRIVSQKLIQADWKKELKCDCNCKQVSSSIRNFNFMMMLGFAASNCMYSEYMRILKSLYKLTGNKYEYTD